MSIQGRHASSIPCAATRPHAANLNLHDGLTRIQQRRIDAMREDCRSRPAHVLAASCNVAQTRSPSHRGAREPPPLPAPRPTRFPAALRHDHRPTRYEPAYRRSRRRREQTDHPRRLDGTAAADRLAGIRRDRTRLRRALRATLRGSGARLVDGAGSGTRSSARASRPVAGVAFGRAGRRCSDSRCSSPPSCCGAPQGSPPSCSRCVHR